jgi:hypothetical protein
MRPHEANISDFFINLLDERELVVIRFGMPRAVNWMRHKGTKVALTR